MTKVTVRCPICRAENDLVGCCRRCKADLTPLAELESRRGRLLREAARAALQGDGDAVLGAAREARQLGSVADGWRWQAAGHLLRREFAQALACLRLAVDSSPPP